MNKKHNNRLYVLVDQSLEPVYGAVQGGHCVAQYMLDNRNNRSAWNNEYLIYLSADVNLWRQILSMKKKRFSEFHEPDLNNKLTAIALVDNGRIFKHLPLLRAN